MSSRLVSAFSLSKNLRRLFVPPDAHLRPLDGIRAFSVLWVVFFHAGWYGRFTLPPATWRHLLRASWMLPIWRGDFGVDIFFVLSGFLIAGILLDERAATGHVALGRFYVRRLLRLWPALLAVLLIDYLTGEPRRGLVWLNALYVNNFVSVWFVALGWTWSLAIEEQFYLVCPWILYAVHRLTTRGRVAALLFLMLALVGVAAIVVTTHDLRPWDAEIVGQLDPLRWGMAFDVFYDKPWMRAGPLLAGVTAAVLFRSAAVMDALARRRIPTGVALVLAILLMAASTHWPLAVGSSRVVEVLYLSTFRAVFGVCAAFIMLVTVSQHPFGRALAKPLSARWLFPVSQLAYPAYLLNPLVTLYVDAWLGPAVSLSEDPMRVLIPCDAIATFACAAILHVTVERPGMELRPRAASSMGEATGPLTQPG